MLSKEEFLGLVAQEVGIYKHLHSKISEGDANYKPTEKQRTTLEVLRYVAHQGSTLATILAKGGDWESLSKRTENMTLEQFPAEMDRELADITTLVNGMSEEELNGDHEMWGMKQPRRLWLVAVVLRQLTAYRMQIFLYLKANGHSELNTSNLWSGQDGKM
jgi:hypothetical protein